MDKEGLLNMKFSELRPFTFGKLKSGEWSEEQYSKVMKFWLRENARRKTLADLLDDRIYWGFINYIESFSLPSLLPVVEEVFGDTIL